MNIRRNFTALSAADRAKLVNAFLKLKREGNPATGRNYDTYVEWHHQIMAFAHRGPAFLPWHRQFLLMIEKELQDVAGDPTLTIPYWDWTEENSESSSLWDADFMGGNGIPPNGRVTTGPFSADSGNWKLVHSALDQNFLSRNLGDAANSLPSSGDVQAALAVNVYDSAPWGPGSAVAQSFRNSLEGFGPDAPKLHNLVHVWIGGEMGEMTSPNDPVFWLHHSNCDRIWADWQDASRDHSYLPINPLPNRPGHSLNEKLAMLGDATVSSVLNFRNLGYRYDTSAEAAPIAAPSHRVAAFALDFATARAFEDLSDEEFRTSRVRAFRDSGPYSTEEIDMRRVAR